MFIREDPRVPRTAWAALTGVGQQGGHGQRHGSFVELWCLRAKALDAGQPEFKSRSFYLTSLRLRVTFLVSRILNFLSNNVGVMLSLSLGLCRINELIAVSSSSSS